MLEGLFHKISIKVIAMAYGSATIHVYVQCPSGYFWKTRYFKELLTKIQPIVIVLIFFGVLFCMLGISPKIHINIVHRIIAGVVHFLHTPVFSGAGGFEGESSASWALVSVVDVTHACDNFSVHGKL